jgi:predicted membrane protein
MIGAVGDRIIASIYSEIPDSSAVSVLDVGPDKALSAPFQAGPGTPDRPRPSLMTRCKAHYARTREAWTGELPFPNPAQAVILALIVALVFLLGNPQRFSAPTYGVVRTYGGVSVWGLGFLVVTATVFVAWRWLHHGLFLAYFMAAAGYATLALAVAQAALHDPAVSWLAVGVFGWLSWVHSMAATRASGEWRIERWLRNKIRRP